VSEILDAVTPRSLALFARTAFGKLRDGGSVNASNYGDYQRQFFARPGIADSTYDRFAALRARIVDLAQPDLDQPVLDVCTGSGWQARAFADAGCKWVTGIDLIPERIAGANARHGGLDIDFREMDASRLEFETGRFQCATLTFGLHDMPPCVRARAIREVARVTRERVIIAEPRPPSNGVARSVYGFVGQLIDESFYFADWTRVDPEELIGDSGLRVIHRERGHHGTIELYVCEPTPDCLTISW
jgi:SAM-dependent methyltransferase